MIGKRQTWNADSRLSVLDAIIESQENERAILRLEYGDSHCRRSFIPPIRQKWLSFEELLTHDYHHLMSQ